MNKYIGWLIFGKCLAIVYIILLPIGLIFRPDDYTKIISRFWNLEFIKYEN